MRTISDSSQVTSVWSAYGHRFLSDGEGTESCLRCGALYQLVAYADDPTSGDYVTAMGDEPAQCTGDTLMVHGYAGETDCDSCQNEGCDHCVHDCPCIRCDS